MTAMHRGMTKKMMAVFLSLVMVVSVVIVPQMAFAAPGDPAAAPAVTKQPVLKSTYAKDADMRLYISAQSVDGGYLTYQWHMSGRYAAPFSTNADGTLPDTAKADIRNGDGIDITAGITPGAVQGETKATFSGTSANTEGYYYYWCEITNNADTDGDGVVSGTDESTTIDSAFAMVHVVNRTLETELKNGDFQTFDYPTWLGAGGNTPPSNNNYFSFVAVDVPLEKTVVPYWNTTHYYSGTGFTGKCMEIQVPGAGDISTTVSGSLSTAGHAGTANSDIKYDWARTTPLIAELSGNSKSSLYQEIATAPGKIYEWSLDFAASARYANTEMVAVVIGSSINAESDYLSTLPSANKRWIDPTLFAFPNGSGYSTPNPGD
jgi:hypothetical protein